MKFRKAACLLAVYMLLGYPLVAVADEISTAIVNHDLTKVKKFVDANAVNRDIALGYACNASCPDVNDRKNVEFIEDLLNRGADPNSSRTGGPAFSWVMEWQPFNPVVASIMVRHGARINADTMICAAWSGIDAVRWLVQRGCSVNIRDRNTGQTAVFIAAANDSAEEVDYLVAQGASLNIHDRDGMTPLMVAAKANDSYPLAYRALHSLIGHGANVNSRGIGGMTALMLLSHREDYPISQNTSSGNLDPESVAISCAKDLVTHGLVSTSGIFTVILRRNWQRRGECLG